MADDTKIKHWNAMYEMPLENIPWEIKDPPQELVELIENGQVKGKRALDIACGTGNYSFYLAEHGFEKVVGVDFSEKALEIARKRNEALHLSVQFSFGDITKIRQILANEQFDFILDYSILHHLEPGITRSHARQCIDLLAPGGKLLLVCYSDKNQFANGGTKATGKYGNAMFYRTADEIREAYQDLKEVNYKETRLGKRLQHIAHCFLFEKV